MRYKSRALLVPVLLLLIVQHFHPARAELQPGYGASRGLPGSPDLGIGAVVHPYGQNLAQAAALSAQLELDWVSVPVTWADLQPHAFGEPIFPALDGLFSSSQRAFPAVMVSLSGAPDWALTPQGPDPAQSARFVLALVKRYPAIKAVELFPGANTHGGWGSDPSPAAYANLFRAVSEEMRLAGSGVLLVAGGLQPVAPDGAGSMNDLEFLAGLYQHGASELMPVISIQYVDVAADLLRYPDGSEQRIVRHYEEVRQAMLANGHTQGHIWITRFGLPSGKIESQSTAPIDPTSQSAWMIQAVNQMRSQLYIGVVFLASLNTNGEGAASGLLVLVQGDGAQHPFAALLGEMVSLNQAGSASITPGKAKDGSFEKKRP